MLEAREAIHSTWDCCHERGNWCGDTQRVSSGRMWSVNPSQPNLDPHNHCYRNSCVTNPSQMQITLRPYLIFLSCLGFELLGSRSGPEAGTGEGRLRRHRLVAGGSRHRGLGVDGGGEGRCCRLQCSPGDARSGLPTLLGGPAAAAGGVRTRYAPPFQQLHELL